jgi:hypothetical protein
MNWTDSFECPECGGWAEFYCSDHGDPVRMSHECNYSCKNHPAINPTALTSLFEEDQIRRAERNAERAFEDYHGGNGPQTDAERDEVFRQQNLGGI